MRSVEDQKRDMEARFGDLLSMPYPAFSEAEMARRINLLEDLIGRLGLDALLVSEAMRAGTATGWITGWPVTAEAVTIVIPGQPRQMYVQHFNHLPLAQKIAWACEILWGRRAGVLEAAQALQEHGAKRVGIIGRLSPAQNAGLIERFDTIDCNRDYAKLRLVKSDEEIRWLRLAAALTDLGVTALTEGARPGLDERELGALVEASFLPYGATSFLHYFLCTSMTASQGGVPRQYASTRKLSAGDVLATEISADFWGYTGQVLRTYFIADEPTPLFRELHSVADAVLDAILARIRPGAHAAELLEASALIEKSGFTIIDDLVHGYGGGYLPPILGGESRPAAEAIPDVTLQAGMALVVQPNIVTTDWSAGVQTGHLVLVTGDGVEPLQAFPRGYQIL